MWHKNHFRVTNQRSISLIAIFCLVLLITITYRGSSLLHISSNFPSPLRESGASALPADCAYFRNQDDIQIIVKTGANEVYKKLPTQLLTSLRCYRQEELLFFSDLEMKIGQYQIRDVLVNVTESVKKSESFDYYHLLQSARKEGRDVADLVIKEKAGWNLDKFKFLHMLEQTWKLRPGKKWYVFIEADTYLIRTNLHIWLDRLNPKDLLYLGSPTQVGGVNFAHGGSGIILSGAALRKYADGDEGVARRWDEKMAKETYGDMGFMKGLKEKGVELKGRWPIIQGETQATIPYGKGQWCFPIITMHHMSSEAASEFWEFEQRRKNQRTPLLIEEIYTTLIASMITDRRDEWDNTSDDVFYRKPGVNGDREKDPNKLSAIEKEAHKSFDKCREACEEQEDCYQFMYKPSEQACSHSRSFRLGGQRIEETLSGKGCQSGWMLERIEKFKKKNACWRPDWLKN